MYDRMIREHGYSIRKLAEKLGKDKGYVENRLRLADAPAGDPRAGVCAQRHPVACLRAAQGRGPEEAPAAGRRRSPAASCRSSSCASGSRAARARSAPDDDGRPRPVETAAVDGDGRHGDARADDGWTGPATRRRAVRDDSLVAAKQPAGRGGRGAGRRPPGAGRRRLDLGGRPGEPRQVPDDREAPARERDRDGPERRHRLAPSRPTRRESRSRHREVPASLLRVDLSGWAWAPWLAALRVARGHAPGRGSSVATERTYWPWLSNPVGRLALGRARDVGAVVVRMVGGRVRGWAPVSASGASSSAA